MLKRKLVTIAAVSTAAGVALTAGIAFVVIKHRRRRRKKQFLSKRKREAITEVIELAADEVMPDGIVASSLFNRHLDNLSDKKLLVLYAAVKAGEYMREAGIDPAEVTAEQIERVREHFNAAENEQADDREALLKSLNSRKFEEVKPLLVEALRVLATA